MKKFLEKLKTVTCQVSIKIDFWYENKLAGRSNEYVMVDADKGLRKAGVKPDRSISYRSSVQPRLRKHWSHTSHRSPDKKFEIFTEDHNIYLRIKGTNETFQLTKDGKPGHGYSSRVFWAPDSKTFISLKTKEGEHRKLYHIESSPKDQLYPKLHTMTYAKPGDRITIKKPHLFNVEKREEIQVSDDLFPNPFRIDEFRWAKDSSQFTFLYNQRGHQFLRVVAINAKTGKTRLVVDERSTTFIDYAYKQIAYFIPGDKELIWMSERDGWNHLYLYDLDTGKVINQITKGSWVVRSVLRVDNEKRQIVFRAMGVFPNQNPYQSHYGTIQFDGSGLTWLTEGDGNHHITFSPNGEFIIDSYSRVDRPPITELRRVKDGKIVCQLEKADISKLEADGWKMPIRFSAKGRDDETDIHGVIYRPTNFDPKKKYPVIEKIYAGPHNAFVPRDFKPRFSGQSMAELGFIVVQIDGMGTNWRSKKFHDVCWQNIRDSGFPDRIKWMKAAAKKYPYMDLSRVGIYGGSAGGQSSVSGMLHYPDFYKVCVSESGCHDNRMDKIWWNEAWMGWPVGDHYKDNSNVTHAHKLQGKLMLILGEMDRNVDPSSTLQLVNALIKADKVFDFVFIPGSGHGIGGRYGRRRQAEFFVRHLLGVEPENNQ